MFYEYLDTLKEQFVESRAMLVLDDKVLRRYVLSWSPLLVRVVHEYPMGGSLSELWECVQVDYQALAELTGDSMPDVLARLRQVQGLQLVYPDGSVPQAVTHMLTVKMRELLGT